MSADPQAGSEDRSGPDAGSPAGGPPAAGRRPPAGAPRAPGPPAWIFVLGLVTVLEPPVLIAAWFADRGLAGGDLLAYALVGGLFITLPSLAILGLAVIWYRRLAAGRSVPGLPPALTGAGASRVSAIALVVSTVLLGLALVLLLGRWSAVALPPLALSLASAWLMGRAAAR